MEWLEGEYRITTDPARADLDVVHGFLAASYWAAGVPRELVRRSIEHSLAFSLWHEPPGGPAAQVGFARVISDRATFAYVGDVFVIESHRGRGLSKWLMRTVVEHPELQGLRRWCLLTRDAHRLYESVGFSKVAAPERWMERWDAEVYRRGAS